MQEDGASPDSITIVCVLKACGFLEQDVHTFLKALEPHSNISIDRLKDKLKFSHRLLVVFFYFRCI